jgi:hypothetical protein
MHDVSLFLPFWHKLSFSLPFFSVAQVSTPSLSSSFKHAFSPTFKRPTLSVSATQFTHLQTFSHPAFLYNFISSYRSLTFSPVVYFYSHHLFNIYPHHSFHSINFTLSFSVKSLTLFKLIHSLIIKHITSSLQHHYFT